MADGKLIFDVEFATSDFKDALKTIEKATKTSMDKVSNQTENAFKKSNSEIIKSSKEVSKTVESNFKGMGKAIAGHLGSIAASMVSAFSVKSAVTSAIQLGTAFENGLAKVSTMVDTNTVDMKKWGKELMDISSQTGISVEEITESTYQALSASVKQEDINKLLLSSSKLAVAGYSDMNTVIDATTSIMNAYNLTGEDTDRIHKILIQTQNKGKTTVAELGATLSGVIPTAVQMGVNLENVGASMAVLTASGIPTAQATTKLNALFTAFAKSGTATSKALDKTYQGTKLAGKSFQDLLKIKPLNEILQDMSKYAEKVGVNFAEFFTSTEASAAASILATTGFDMLTEALQAMGTEADVVGEGFDKNQTITKRWEIATNKLRNQAMTLFEMLLPAIEGFLNVATGVIDWFTNLDPLVQQLIVTMGIVAGVLGTIIPLVISLGVATNVAIWPLTLIVGVITAVVTAIGLAIWAVANMVKGFDVADSGFGKFARGSINLVIGAVNFLIGALNLLIKTINLIPGVNVPIIPKIQNVEAKYATADEKSKAKETNKEVIKMEEAGRGAYKETGNLDMEYINKKFGTQSFTPTPAMARGGTVDGGSIFIAGEAGRELLMTDRGKTTVIPLNANNPIGGNNINLTFNVSGGNIDERKLSDMVLTKLSRNLRV